MSIKVDINNKKDINKINRRRSLFLKSRLYDNQHLKLFKNEINISSFITSLAFLIYLIISFYINLKNFANVEY